jgi:glycosyltransferase involved in cell wall biosynthesis
LGNLSLDKGLDTVLALFRGLRREGLPVRLALAGPAAGPAEARLIADAQTEFGSELTYVGPVYRADKDAFLHRLDAFLFPSRYANEAQPLVLFEAMAAGVPVIATERGCVGDDVTRDSGLVVADEAAYLEAATALIRRWAADGEGVNAAGRAAQRRMQELREDARAGLGKIVEIITGINGLEAGSDQNGYMDAAQHRRGSKSLSAHAGRT